MGFPGLVGLFLIIANILFTYRGLKNTSFFDGYKFEVDKILVYKDYKRLITSSFLHVSWTHLFFNMLGLYFFSSTLEASVGPFIFLLIYFACMVAGDLLTLLVHRNHGEYSSVGASGAVSGIIFASIALIPGMTIYFFIIPIWGWLYGLLFIAGSIYAIKTKKGNIGNESHLGGALMGMLVIFAIYPSAVIDNYVIVLLLTIPTIAFIILIIAKPHLLIIDGFRSKKIEDHFTVDNKYNAQKSIEKKEIDRILDKISARGMKSLTPKEKETLEQYSKSSH